MQRKGQIVYPYIPNSVPETKQAMMKEIGISDIMELYEREIPAELRFKEDMQLPEPIYDEYTIKRHTEKILAKNKNCKDYLCFLGAGCAPHFVPAVCDEINGRGEFLTAYVGESIADHGKWQALWEYCSLMAELCAMDVLSIPMYDGAQAAASSIRMANRINGRTKALIPEKMSPEILMVIRNYVNSMPAPDIELVTIKCDSMGRIDINDLQSKCSQDVCAVYIENPAYLGTIETRSQEIGTLAKEAGAEYIVYTDPISLGIIEAPANYGATITCGDFHSLGIHLHAGGGQGGFIAAPDDMKYIAEFKDLMFGITETIVEGEYGFGEVLYDRTSYGARDKANEFTGTSTGLWAITAGVYLALMGPKGMEEVGTTIMQKAQYAARKIGQIQGIEIKTNPPFFKEFVVNFDHTNKTVGEINQALLNYKIFGGNDLSCEFPDLGQSALYCVTEIHSQEDIDQLCYALQGIVTC
ncbi:MAG TPA: aminomethyl-transferring glycine dehydrogenase subunit GcvPA [Syntrophomonadaceae bacterium]|nr:aminomethyl-transferring glycine dehydrogenase subunit GcvPA [Syntrophomonadaceae bacterium]